MAGTDVPSETEARAFMDIARQVTHDNGFSLRGVWGLTADQTLAIAAAAESCTVAGSPPGHVSEQDMIGLLTRFEGMCRRNHFDDIPPRLRLDILRILLTELTI